MADNDSGLASFEEKASALLDAYRLGTPDALEQHYRLTWHRRAWRTMRTYVQLDLGKRPATPDGDVDITIDDARHLVAREHGYADWAQLVAAQSAPASATMRTAAPVSVHVSGEEDADALLITRDWNEALEVLAAKPDVVLDARGQATDEMLRDLGRLTHLTTLRLGGSKGISDAGLSALRNLPNLRELDVGGTGITDAGLDVLAELPNLERLSLAMTAITDAAAEHLRGMQSLRTLHVSWTRTGDAIIRALAGSQVAHFTSGNSVTDDGLAALRDLPALAAWRGGDGSRVPLDHHNAFPTRIILRGTFTDVGVERLRGLNGLFGLALDGAPPALTARAMRSLAALPNLGWLNVDARDDWMAPIAEMPALRSLHVQDTEAGDDGFTALSKSRTIERIWGRRCHNLRTRGFIALSRMPSLSSLSVSCLNVSDEGIATLPEFPSLRELMPMDVPDAGYRHIARCVELEALTLMYCRDTTDAATEQIVALPKLKRYFNSYTTITDRTPQLLSTVDSLEEVVFDECHSLTNAGIVALARLPHLREVRVAGRGVTPALQSAFASTVRVRVAGA